MSDTATIHLMLTMIKGQLDEVHESINNDLLRGVDLNKTRHLKFTDTISVVTNIRVTNVSGIASQSKLVVEELTRLKTVIDSLQKTIDMVSGPREEKL